MSLARFILSVLVLVFFCAVTGRAFSQAVVSADPSARQLIRQKERESALREQQEPHPSVRLGAPGPSQGNSRLPQDESPCFKIDRLVLKGDGAKNFQWLLALAEVDEDGRRDPPHGRCLGSAGINLVMKRMQNALIAKGFVTSRVLAQPQNLSGGTLELTLIPGRIRHVRFAEDSNARATQWNAMPASPGDLLNLRDIEQALENFKRVPTAEADIQIAPAEGPDAKPGDSDVVIHWRQALPFRVNAYLDNSGAKETGKYQDTVTLSYDDWWTLNDLFYISVSRSLGGDPGEHGTEGYTLHYSLPFGYWLLGVTGGSNRYRQLVAGATQTYLYRGDSTNLDVSLSRVAYRDAARKAVFSVAGWARSSGNYIDDTEIAVQHRRMAGWRVGLGDTEYIGASTVSLNAAYRHGTGAMGAIPAPEEAFGEGASRPRMLDLDAHLTVPFGLSATRLRYDASWRGQWSWTVLVPQDRFAIGSRYTVRGFDEQSILSGDRGWLVRNDLGMAIGNGQETYLGIDYGEVGGPSSRQLVGRHLSGMALGLRGAFRSLSYDMFTGWPLSKPQGFATAPVMFGFSLNWSC